MRKLKDNNKKGIAMVYFDKKDKFTGQGWYSIFFYNDKTRNDTIEYGEEPNWNDNGTYTNKKETLKMIRDAYSKLYNIREDNEL